LEEPEVHPVMLLRVKTLLAVFAQQETATSTTPAAAAREREVPEVTHRHQDQPHLEQMLALVVEELHQQSPERQFVTQPVVVVVCTGMVATLEPEGLVLRRTQPLAVPAVKVA
jgi:hypothetical protein